MSSLRPSEKAQFEKLFGMDSGYVLNYSDGTFADFFAEIADIEIHSENYTKGGTSKAKKLRCFWNDESDALVGKVLIGLLDHWRRSSDPDPKRQELHDQCREIANRLLSGGPRLSGLKATTAAFDAYQLSQQIRRMEDAIEDDPALAIGTAKELIETVCHTILAERGKPVEGTPDIPVLTKQTLKELNLLPDGVSAQAKGAETIKRTLSNLASVAQGLTELRNLYGTGHGRHGNAKGLKPRHAKLAVGAAATLATFLFETHSEVK